jgi:hypothetical protein
MSVEQSHSSFLFFFLLSKILHIIIRVIQISESFVLAPASISSRLVCAQRSTLHYHSQRASRLEERVRKEQMHYCHVPLLPFFPDPALGPVPFLVPVLVLGLGLGLDLGGPSQSASPYVIEGPQATQPAHRRSGYIEGVGPAEPTSGQNGLGLGLGFDLGSDVAQSQK